MPRGRRTPLSLAATAAALHDAGFPPGYIAAQTGLGLRTVDAIVGGVGSLWATLPNTEAYQQARREQQAIIQRGLTEIVRKAMIQVEVKLPEASAYHAAIVMGIAIDKERLIAGEATQHIAIHAKVEIEQLDALAAKLAQALLPSITPTP